MPRILVCGAGAVGQFVGGLVSASTNHEVTLLGRANYYSAIKTRGLILKRPRMSVRVDGIEYVHTIDSELTGRKFDWIFLTVKSYDIIDALKQIKPIIMNNKNIKIMLFQQGVGSHNTVKKVIPEDQLYIATLTANLDIVEAGIILQTNPNAGIAIAPLNPKTNPYAVTSIFNGRNIPVQVFRDWKPMKWSALLMENFANGLCALSYFNPPKMLEDKTLLQLEVEAFQEGLKVINKMNIKIIDLQAYPVKQLALYSKLPSFLRDALIKHSFGRVITSRVSTLKTDVIKGKTQSEVNYLNGAIAHAGSQLDIKTQVNRFINNELQDIVSGKASPDVYRRNIGAIYGYCKGVIREESIGGPYSSDI